jgi:hypothetical protein
VNTYRLKFQAKCPVDGSSIEYEWALHSGFTVMAEELRRIADGIGEGLHEKIADDLFDRFGGSQCLRAVHAGGVTIETIRPDLAHWRRHQGFDGAPA